MSKIDTNTVREKVVTMMGDLREVVDLYMRNEAEVAVVEGNHTFSREYKDTQIEKLREMGQIAGSISKNAGLCQKNNLQLNGYAYEAGLNDFVISDEEDYITKIMIKIDEIS